ncbi:MAG: ArsR/SmtB family transcription factor [Candidatus Aminicenantales bacterium]
MEDYAIIFKALSDKTRLRIINLLIHSDQELCVCELVDALAEPQYKISKHLKELKYAGLIEEKKIGRWVYYSLLPARDNFEKFILKAISSIRSQLTAKDEARLQARLLLRKDGLCVVGLESKKWQELSKE